MLTFKSQLNSLPSLLNHLQQPSQRDSLNYPSAGLGSSLYSLGAEPTENTVSIVIGQEYLECCLLIRCSGKLFTDSLPSNSALRRHVTIFLRVDSNEIVCTSGDHVECKFRSSGTSCPCSSLQTALARFHFSIVSDSVWQQDVDFNLLKAWGQVSGSRRKHSWLRHYATGRKVVGSSRTMSLGSTQPLTEMSTRTHPGGKGWPVGA
jgi:hypothetical protein